MADLSKERDQEPFFPQWAFTGFNLHRNTGKAKLFSGSNDQTIDNIQRTLRAYFESGSDSQRAIKLWGNKLIPYLDPYHLN